MKPSSSNGPSGLKIRRHSRSQSADVTQLEAEQVLARRNNRIHLEGGSKSNASASNIASNNHSLNTSGPTPRSPRAPQHIALARPSRDRLANETKKKREGVLAERAFLQISSEGRTPEQRRYVAPGQHTKQRGHRRAVSLSVSVDGFADSSKSSSAVSPSSIELRPRHNTRSLRRGHPHTMRPVKTTSSKIDSGIASDLPQKKLSIRLAQLQKGHRRANSWDPRVGEERSGNGLEQVLASRQAELAHRERALLEKQSRQEAELKSLSDAHEISAEISAHSPKSKSFSNLNLNSEGVTVEREVEELLRLQRKLKSSPERRRVQVLLSSPAFLLGEKEKKIENRNQNFREIAFGRNDFDVSGEEEADLAAELDGLNEELENLKKRTLSIEHRVAQLRCPGPTPLEMMTGGAIHKSSKSKSSPSLIRNEQNNDLASILKKESSDSRVDRIAESIKNDSGFLEMGEASFSSSPLRGSNVRRVQARRSPVVLLSQGPGRSGALSPEQSKEPPGFVKTPSFSSAFSPINVGN